MENLSQPQVGAQASPSPETLVTPEQATENKPLTRADFEELITKEIKPLIQSQVDKAANRISKEAKEKIDALKQTQSVLNLSDEDVEKATNKIVMNDLTTRQAEQASPATQTQTSQTQTEQVHPAIAALLEIFQAEGVEIVETDPEWKDHIQKVWNDPSGTIPALRKAAYQAVNAKQQRKAANSEQAPARVVSGGQSNQPGGASTSTNAHDAWQEAYKK